MRGDFGLVQGVSDVAILDNYKQEKREQEDCLQNTLCSALIFSSSSENIVK